ncbi:hypothetical protein SBOR_7667 [Sclerotinia borealis F-4128]|uniref:Uncharacterized protein n=1 Tax=Sclerotinia borealis (strain F-4128) TaxID=1432307 RepID=W9C842_SCLBF|nr:hypothetical protein SBOR_7667 [Sclerotinia borealis F-4128]
MAILRRNPNPSNKGKSQFFKWNTKSKDWHMTNCDGTVSLSSVMSSQKGPEDSYGATFKTVEYGKSEHKWKDGMRELEVQTFRWTETLRVREEERKAKEKKERQERDKLEKAVAAKEKKEGQERKESEKAVAKKERVRQLEKATRQLNLEAAADANEGGKGKGKKSSHNSGRGEGSKQRADSPGRGGQRPGR